MTTEKSTSLASDVRTGVSIYKDHREAVKELAGQIFQPDAALVVVFVSSHYNLDELGPLLKNAFRDCPVIGCTTAGEITPNGYSDNSITGFSLSAKHTQVKTYAVDSLENVNSLSVRAMSEDAQKQIESFRKNNIGADEFALFLVDGMSGAEEKTVALVHQALKDVPLVGGSAGDNLKFEKSWVLFDGEFRSNSAVIALVSTVLPFEIFKTQHFLPTETKMVITQADQSTRTVYEINGLPAAEEYARLIGLKPDELVPEVFSRYPIMLEIGGEYYVRSLQKKNADGSLTFYCAIDNGLVLTIARGVNLVENLKQTLRDLSTRLPNSQLLITCECILRRLEVQKDNKTQQQVDELLKTHNAIGFHSYGEQYNAIHVNQTFTGVLIGKNNDR
jgi:hypothetical protein